MTDYLAKARQGRIDALSLRESGSVMFFPEEMDGTSVRDRAARRSVLTEMSKPMFVRSSTVRAGAMIATPRVEDVANAPLVLTADDMIDAVLRRAA